MFLSLEQPIVISLIAIIAVQYAFATFCLMKLATIDLPRKNYVLWNVFILLVFFVGDIAFLIYYFKVGKSKRIPEFVPPESGTEPETVDSDGTPADNNGIEEQEQVTESAENESSAEVEEQAEESEKPEAEETHSDGE